MRKMKVWFERFCKWVKGQWAIRARRPLIIILGVCCLGLAIGGLVLLILFFKWLILTIILPVIGIGAFFLLWNSDKLVDNYNANQEARQIAEQQQEAAAKAVFYEILRGIVLPVLELMTGKQIYEGVCIYEGPYLYGPGETGPIYYYEISPDFINFAKDLLKKKEFRSRVKRKIAEKYQMSLETAKYCVITGTGIDGMQLVLISLDPELLPQTFSAQFDRFKAKNEKKESTSESRVC